MDNEQVKPCKTCGLGPLAANHEPADAPPTTYSKFRSVHVYEPVGSGTKPARRSHSMSETEFVRGDNDREGRCTSCGAEAYGCEPDTVQRRCTECGNHQVYGLAELLTMGLIDITAEEDDG